MNQLQTTPPSKPEETDEQKQIRISKAFEDWMTYYLDKKNKDTYGNATQSAIKAYNYDPETQYAAAGVQGNRNVKKAKELRAMYAESKGFGMAQFTDYQLARSMDASKPDSKSWFDDLMVDLGYRDPKGAQIVVNNNQQVNNIDINAPEAVDFNKKFKKFLEAEA